MSKDQYTVHDSPDMKPKHIDIALHFYNTNVVQQITNRNYPDQLSAREYVEEEVRKFESGDSGLRVKSIEYWLNVKADK